MNQEIKKELELALGTLLGNVKIKQAEMRKFQMSDYDYYRAKEEGLKDAAEIIEKMIKEYEPREYFGFEKALELMKKGFMVTREAWCSSNGSPMSYIHITPLFDDNANATYLGEMISEKSTISETLSAHLKSLSVESLMAKDWFLYEKEKK